MPYGPQSEYNKFQSTCDCENCDSNESCSCKTSDDCGCCPVGTVAIYDDCGKHIGCLNPSDAAQYFVDTVDVPEGFIKIIGPDGEYIGLLTIADYGTYLTSTGQGLTFNTTGPITITPVSGTPGSFDVVVQSSFNAYNSKVPENDATTFLTNAPADVAGSTTLQFLSLDRNSYFGDVQLTLANLPTGINNLIPGGTLTIPANKSILDGTTGFISFGWDAISAGVYNFDVVLTGTDVPSVTLTVTVTFS